MMESDSQVLPSTRPHHKGCSVLSPSLPLGASRNQVGDASERQRLQLKVLKSRHTGMTGEVDKLLYDQKTGRLVVYEDFI